MSENQLVAASKAPSIIQDLGELYVESLPFLKTQWVFLAICTIGSAISACNNSLMIELSQASVLLTAACWIIVPILKLFYVSYLAAPRNPALVSTIGVFTMACYMMGEYIQNFIITLGLFLMFAPGFYFMTRTSLFLPIYAVEGRRPLKALKRSWTVTRGKFGQICFYLGPVASLVFIFHWLPYLGSFVHNGPARPVFAVVCAASGVAFMLADMILAGLMYKLYLRLNQPSAVSQLASAAKL